MESRRLFDHATVVSNTALMLGWIIVLATALRAVVAREIEPVAVSLAAVCALLMFTVYRQLRRGAPAGASAVTVLAVCIFIYAALSWSSDGFAGSIVLAAPMLPLLASLLLGRRATRNVTIITAGILLFMLAQHMSGNLHGDPDFPEEILYAMRALILLFCLIAVNWICSYFSLVAGTADDAPFNESADELTGLLRRDVIVSALEREFARARRAEAWLSFALIEIDQRAAVEAEYGPQGAYNCLLGVAEGLGFSMRRSADALGRFDEWELCVLMSDTRARGAARVGEKVRALIETLDISVKPGVRIRLTVSVGICAIAARGLLEPDDIVEGACQALADARRTGGNAVSVLELPGSPEEIS